MDAAAATVGTLRERLPQNLPGYVREPFGRAEAALVELRRALAQWRP